MGKAIMFLVWMWVIVSLTGGIMSGSHSLTATTLTVSIDDEDDSQIVVTSTEGYPDTGAIMIGDEKIQYPAKTATTFTNSFAQPIVRGASNTDAVSHSAGTIVRTVEAGMINSVLSYKIAVIADASGLVSFVTVPFALISLLLTFAVLPISFLGTAMEWLTYIWAIIVLGIIVAIAIAIVGGRRV